jgi:hypothetical protein
VALAEEEATDGEVAGGPAIQLAVISQHPISNPHSFIDAAWIIREKLRFIREG